MPGVGAEEPEPGLTSAYWSPVGVVVKLRLGTVEAALTAVGRRDAAANVREVLARKARRDNMSSLDCSSIGWFALSNCHAEHFLSDNRAATRAIRIMERFIAGTL